MGSTTLVTYVGPAKFARGYGFLLIGASIGAGMNAPFGGTQHLHNFCYYCILLLLCHSSQLEAGQIGL